MASLQQEPTGTFHVVVRIHGKRFKRSLGTKSESEAITKRDEIHETLDLIGRDRILVPNDVSAIDFVMAGGNVNAIPVKLKVAEKPTTLTLKSLLDQFFDSIPAGSFEDSTLKTMQIHRRHLLRVLKPKLEISKLSGQVLQSYVNGRAREGSQYFADKATDEIGKKRKRRLVSATTIRKEIVTLGSIWRWGNDLAIVNGPFPNRGIRFPKTEEKPPFQTWAEITRQIEQDELGFDEAGMLWNCLYLRKSEIGELLEHVRLNAKNDFIYPMLAFAAYTGARRSELLRSKRSDFDFESQIVTIRERKRMKGRRSTRRVPLTPKLQTVMENWFENSHPGGPSTFAYLNFAGSPTPIPISVDQAHKIFRQAVDGSKWERIKGWHCLRHSFISNLACAGVDQRMIDDFVGHSTDEMRRRYRHLFPDVKHAALNQVFG